MNWMRLTRATFGLFTMTSCLTAQETIDGTVVNPTLPEETEVEETGLTAQDGSIFNESNARTMTISIPAPRGLILDREGRPLAQTRMAYHLALDFTQYKGEDKSPAAAVAWAQERIAEANTLVNGNEEYSDAKLTHYYKNRRWLPRKISQILTEKEAKKLESDLPEGLALLPVYQRFYPMKSLGAHLIGYVGAQTVLPSGPINDGDPLFQSTMGKAGFERVFDSKLRGIPGQKKMIFDKDGRKVHDEAVRVPRPGGNVVTTIDMDWQQYAERVLREGCKRGAMVVIDIHTGEVLVMASRPTFDLNEFVPYITNERYKELSDDPSKPLFGRAFQAAYPPASTFKPVITLASITSGAIRYNQKFNCQAFVKVGERKFYDHSRKPKGWVGPKLALAISNNPWFIQAGMKTGPQTFLSVARRMGYGSKTGLPLVGESAGIMPSPEYIKRRMGRTTTDGDTANLAIGQGLSLSTPLQVAQSMAAIGNGSALLQLQLVRQIQDFHGRVIEAPLPTVRNNLNVDASALRVTREGMRNVVHASYGTGKRADIGFTIMCGKTGTAQWKPEINQNLAWFAGFFPFDNPRYAYAVVYEGVPGESVSGGRKAAPMVKRFFRKFRSEIQTNLKPAGRATIVRDDRFDEEEEEEEDIPRALIVNEDDEEEIPVAEPVVEDPPVPTPEPGDPSTIPSVELPTVPEAEPVDPPKAEPVAPTDEPTQEPEVPADQ